MRTVWLTGDFSASSDNILIAFETLHHLKTKKTGKMGFMAMKLDISKVFDRVEWIFLVKLMERIGFHEKWIGWVYECISLVSFSIMVNGEPRGNIAPTRGSRQGDRDKGILYLLTFFFSIMKV